jgi:hypothetical protein
MDQVKRFAAIFAIGGILGAVIVGLLAPKMLGWYWETPLDIGVSCKPAVDWGVGRFQDLQLISIVAGGVLNSILFMTVFRRRNTVTP